MSDTLKQVNQILDEIVGGRVTSGKELKEVIRILMGQGKSSEYSGFGFNLGEVREPLDVCNQTWNNPYYRELRSNRRFVGKFLIFIRRVIRRVLFFLLVPISDQQNTFNASVSMSLNAFYNYATVFQSLMMQARNELNEEKERLHAVEAQNMELVEKCRNLETQYQNLSGKNIYDYIDYMGFENRFRGSRELIKQQQSSYLQYLQDKNDVIDLGCGRGEFLEVLNENGFNAIGVDLYPDFLTLCQKEGVKLVEEDALVYMSAIDEQSLDAITAFHLIEHLFTGDLVKLCKQSFEKLRPKGVLIFETPNPACLSTYTDSFYVDPTHTKPIHPETLVYYLDMAGFNDIRVVYTESSKTGYRLPKLEIENEEMLGIFNSGIDELSNKIYGSKDYAVIAIKGEPNP